MPIISRVGARSMKVRLVYGLIFLVLMVGALTMLYPFSLMLAGYLPVEHLHVVPRAGAIVFEGAIVLLLANVGVKYIQRRKFLQELYKSRLSPEDLLQMLDSGEKVVIVDLRHPLDSISDPRVLPGAIRMLPEELEEKASTLPADKEVVLYCT